MKNDFSLFKESMTKCRGVWTVFGKDILFYIVFFVIFSLYYFTLAKTAPADPGFTQETMFLQAQEVLEQKAAELQGFYIFFFILSAFTALLLLILHSVFREWVWSGILKKKCEWKKVPGFIGVNTVIYALIFLLISFFTLFLQKIVEQNPNLPVPIFYVLSYLAILIVLPITLHLSNISAYYCIKQKSFWQTKKNVFTSFAKTKELLIPYGFVLIIFFVFGIFSNLFKNGFFQVIATLILLLFFSWQKVYLAAVYEDRKI